MLLRNLGKTNCLTYIPEDIKQELDPLNVNVVGSPTINNGVVSNFSANNYLVLPSTLSVESNTWEICLKYKFYSSKHNGLIGYTGTGLVKIFVNTSNKVQMALGNSTGSFNVGEFSGATRTANVWNWFKLIFTGSKYEIWESTDGIDYTLSSTLNTSSKVIFPTDTLLGKERDGFLNGEIDLTQSYIKINGATWWKGGTDKLTLKTGSKVYVPVGKTEKKYYKYDDSQNLINLADSDNNILITDGKMVTGNRYKWSTTQTYNLNNPVEANKIYVTFSDSTCQANAYLNTTITAITNKGNFTLISKNFGYGVAANETIEYELPIQTTTTGITIYIQSNARSSSYSYAQVTIGVSANKIVESTSSDYDYTVETGQNVFNEVVIDSDKQLTVSDYSSTSSDSDWFVFYNTTNSSNRNGHIDTTFSGDTAPTLSSNYAVWYDTANNFIKYTNDKGLTWTIQGTALPLCLFTRTSGIATSIDQVFNGFGYIGGVFYTLPNVEGNGSDGLNPNGTYKIIPFKTSTVVLRTDPVSNASLSYALQSKGTSLTRYNNFTLKEDGYLYAPDGRKIYGVDIGEVVYENNKITSFTPSPVQTTDDYKSYMLHCKVRKYYKYQNWTQPILTSNGTLGGDSFACSQSAYLNAAMAFRCFNGDTTTNGESNRWQINNVNTSTQYWISWYNPKPLKTSSIKVYNNEATYVVKNWELCGSDDNVNWTTLATGTNTNTTAFSSWTISVPSSAKAYKYFRLNCTPNSTTSMQIGEIQITAQELVSGTSSNYDYYEIETQPYLFARGERKYYKYSYTNWTQPTMTSNTSYGTLTASVVNSGSAIYAAFDKNTSSWWEAMTGKTAWINWKLPVTLKITGIKIQVRTGNRPNITCRCYTNSSMNTPIGDSITTSTAGQVVDVANIPSGGVITDNIYFDCSSTQDYMGILEITITAQEQSVVEGTIDDYDYFEYESFKLY